MYLPITTITGLPRHFTPRNDDRERICIEKSIITLYRLGTQNLAYIQMIVIGVYAKHMLRSWSLQYMSVIKMAFMFNCTPFIAAVISFWFYRERISYSQCIGIGFGCMGMIPLLWIRSETGYNLREFFFISAPDLALLLAIVAHCYGMQISRTLIRDKQQSASLTNGIRMLGGGILCLLTAFWAEGWFPVTQSVPFTMGLLILVVSTNILCHGLYLQSLRTHSITLLALTDFLEPLFTIGYGGLFLHECITWHYPLAMVLVLVGLYLFYQGECRKSRVIA